MIKKKYLLFIIIITLINIALPINIKAETVKEFEESVAKYTKELENKKENIARNNKEIEEIKKKIQSIEKEIEKLQEEIELLQDEIDEANEEINQKTEESKAIIEYYQVSNGENAYLEYAFGADNITDMIYRLSVVEQLTEYNDKIMKELEELIKENEKRQANLKAKKQELKILEENLEEEKKQIQTDTEKIKETMPAIIDQINAAKKNVEYYKSLGCGETEDIQKCQYRIEQARLAAEAKKRQQQASGSVPSTNGFFRPIESGYITQGYSGYGGHLGIDISSSNKTIPIYPIASGQIFFKGRDSYGALVIKIRHNYNGRYIYSTYAHMSKFGNISQGQMVTANTWLGNMGNTGYSFGSHLHLEITNCDWNPGGGCTWWQYQRNTINPFRLISLPSRWNNR